MVLRGPEDSLIVRFALAATLALAIAGAVLALYQVARSLDAGSVTSVSRDGNEDPRLARCRDAFIATAEDVLCFEAWAAARARFLRGSDDAGSVPSDLSPVDETASEAVDAEAGSSTLP